VQNPFLRGADGFRYTPAAVAHHCTFCVQATFAHASRDILTEFLEKIPGASLTFFTGVGSRGISERELFQLVEEDGAFDRQRMFVDVYCRDRATGGSSGDDGSLGKCALM